MNPDLAQLHPYPFEKLAALKAGVEPADKPHIALSVGEPRHPAPQIVLDALIDNIRGVESYPATKGSDALRAAIADWLSTRFELPQGSLDPQRHVLPVTGTREALFAFAQAVVDRTRDALVLSPNPFYQIYEGAALLAGAQPWYYPLDAERGYQPDFEVIPDAIWQRCQLLYICTPGNPSGAVIPKASLQFLIRKAEEFDFIIASDECYSEIYFEEKPVGLLQAAADMGLHDYSRCVVFHSLSKRSNLPGLRSGFVAGDAEVLARFLQYRTYHGCAMPPATQAASIVAWSDEKHVEANRAEYRKKFDSVLDILSPVISIQRPDASFYLWPQLPVNDMEFARGLFAEHNITVLPGSYLSREINGHNPGANHVRMALVAELDNCIEAAHRIRNYMETLA